MIFITLGSQKFQFNRLICAVDEQMESQKITDVVFAQIGASDYVPKNYHYKDYLDHDEFALWQNKAEIVITHGGTGAIIGALKKGKKVIAVPRLAKYGEHVDDHQLQLLEQFDELGLICKCVNCEEIWKAIDEVKRTEYNKFQSNTKQIINNIEKFIECEFI